MRPTTTAPDVTSVASARHVDALRRWHHNRFMSAYGVDPEPVPHGVEECADSGDLWWARSQSTSGWWFALAGNPEHDEFFFDAADQPTGPPGTDPRWIPQEGPVSPNWHPPSEAMELVRGTIERERRS
jgi:hypothetical protein